MNKKIALYITAVAACLLMLVLLALGIINRADPQPYDPETTGSRQESYEQQTEQAGTAQTEEAQTDDEDTKQGPEAQDGKQDPTAATGGGNVERWTDPTVPATQTDGKQEENTSPPVSTQPAATETTGKETAQVLTYEEYLSLSAAEQQAYFRSFKTVEEFYEWLDSAQAEYKKQHPEATGNGSIDIGDYIP